MRHTIAKIKANPREGTEFFKILVKMGDQLKADRKNIQEVRVCVCICV
jgi:hypothetical protein